MPGYELPRNDVVHFFAPCDTVRDERILLGPILELLRCLGDLFEVWVESTAGGGLTPESASGSCVDTAGPSNPRLRAPAVSMNWPTPIRGFSVSGADVDLPDGAPGTVQYDGVKQVVFSFVSVDCSLCGTPGWYELHSMLWNPATRAVSLGIFYLVSGVDAVTLAYTLSMPVLMRGPQISYPATWSRTVPSSRPESQAATPEVPTPRLARPSPPVVQIQP